MRVQLARLLVRRAQLVRVRGRARARARARAKARVRVRLTLKVSVAGRRTGAPGSWARCALFSASTLAFLQ